MLFRLNMWRSPQNRRSLSLMRPMSPERLEERVLLTASLDLPAGEVADVSTLNSEEPASAAESSEHVDSGVIGSFYLPTQYRLLGNGSLLSGPSVGAPLDIAVSFLRGHADELGLNADILSQFKVTSQYTDEGSGITHLYLRQTIEGLEVVDADISISIAAGGEVIHVSSSFVTNAHVVENLRSPILVNASQAFMQWSDDLSLGLQAAPAVIQVDAEAPDSATVLSVGGSTIEDVMANLVYVPTPEGLELAWRIDVHDSDYRHWLDAFVSATSGKTIYTDNRIENATYNVFALPARSPIDGNRSIVADPQEVTASPFGWHDTNGVAGAEFTDTRGNNATAQEDVNADDAGGFRPSGGAGLSFDFPLDTTQDPHNSQSAAITNAFYWINLLHDIHYQYGFTEAAGNFQVNNYGRGGVGNDPVIIDVQDGASVGGGGFAAFPDGQSPRLTLQRYTGPFRDSALDNDVLIHEFGHGISERLTGGPANTSALNAVQSRAMSEGWGDWWAIMLTQVASDAKLDAYPLGNYSAGNSANGPGIRTYPYSFDMSIDPLTYNNFNGGAVNNESHKAGTIWASALWDMNWLLIDKHGFSSDMLHGTGGNNLALQLVMDGLKLQGTNPSFLAGRDAILAADVALTGGENQTEIWTAFARRGMGFSASDGGSATSTTVVQAFDVPGSISGTVFRDDDASGTQNGAEPGLAGRTVFLDLNNNGVLDLATTTTFNSADTPKALPDAPNILSTRTISGLSGVITDINVTVNVTHPNVGDLYITLISPGNTPVILANYLGGNGDNYTNTTFDDEAVTYISTASAPFTGSFRPYFDLAQLDGRDPNGTWKLRIDDGAAGNTGTLLSWSMQITYGNADPVTVTDGDGNYSFYGLGDATHHVREIVEPGFTQTAPVGGVHDVVISGGQPVSGRDFGIRAAATVSNVNTLEDTLSTAIGINPTVGAGISNFKISGISGGKLFKNNGVTQINNGDFITVAEGQAGVKFLPAANSNVAGQFDVELSQDGSTVVAQTSKATSTITVTPVGDTPQVANTTTLEDTLSGVILISRNANDGNEVTHFKISGITGGTLFKSDGVTQIVNGSFITFAEAQAGVRFLPAANSTADGHFDVEASQNGTTVAAQSSKASSTMTVTPVGDTPQVASIATLEDVLSGVIAIGRFPLDGSEVTHFRVSGITGGTLFKSDGVTQIVSGSFITFAEAQSGVRFLPLANSIADGHFDVEASQNGATVSAQSGKANSTVSVTPVGDTPQVANITTLEDTLSGVIVISRNANDGSEVTHFRISGTTGGTLFKSDGVTQIVSGSFITFAEAQAGVRFLPAANSTADGHFDVEASQNGTTVAAQSGKASSTVSVTPVGDTPQVANMTTLEDTLSGVIVISRNANDGNEVTHFKISGITGGTLFKSDSVTQIVNGSFITFAEAQAGVRFLPAANSTVDGHFDVESSQNGTTVAAQSGKANSTVSVTPVGDTPQVANITTLEDTLSGVIPISRNANDGNEVTHFKVSGITGGTLFKSDGVTQVVNGSFITFAEAQAGVRFLPAANSTADGHFDVESSQNGTTVAAQSGKANSTITVTPVGNTPQVANITTLEDTLSSVIVISRNANDGNEVTHFKISGITGGTLFKSDGVTQIVNGSFITFAEAQAGVRFLPTANSTADGHFDVESSQNGTTVAAQSGKANSTVSITPVGDTPQVANITTFEDTLSGVIAISRNANDGSEVTHFRISGITGGTLFKSDGVTQIVNGSFITFAEAQAGVRFLPAANSTADGHFDVEASQNGTTVAAQSGKASSTVSVTPVGDTPQVANMTTLEDTLSGVIVISRNANDGNEVTHFKISGITGGTLFKSDGVTQLVNGSFITFVEAQAGVRFLPDANSTADGHFDVEASQNGTTVAAQSGKANSTVSVTPVGDTPQVANITTLEDTLSGVIVISRNANDGNEVTHFKISGLTGGTLFKSDGVTQVVNGSFITFAEAQAGLRFLPAANSTADGHFDVESSQNGTTVSAQSGKANSTVSVTPVGDTPQVANITTLEDTLSGVIVISRNANDDNEVTHFKISGITGGTLFKSDSVTQIVNGSFFTFAEAQAGLRFLPTANSTADGHFDVEASQNGTTVAAQSGKASSTVSVTPVGDTPQVANIATLEDTLSGVIVISRNVNDGNEVTHFRISSITGGTLFKSDGVTQIVNGSFITFAEAQAGVRFLPLTNSTLDGHFDVESSQNGTTVAAQSGKVSSTVSVTPVGDTPLVVNITTLEDTLSGVIVISRNANDGNEVTHIRISGITGGTLFKSDGVTQIVNGSFITFAEAQAGARFLPAADSTADGHFDVEASQNGTTVAAQNGKASSTVSVTPVGDTPQVANITTLEDTLSGVIVINRNVNDGNEVTHFKISGITGGTLFKSDGPTQIVNGSFITFAEAQAGVRFLPAANSTLDGHFDVEASQNGTTVAAQSGKASSTVSVTPVGDTPQVASITTLEDTLSGVIVISRNVNDGNEVTHFKISGIAGGTLFKSDGVTQIVNGSFITFAEAQAGVRFLPAANSTSDGHFDVEASQNGTTVATQSGKAGSTITVTPINDPPTIDSIPDPLAIFEDANGQTIGLSGISSGGGENQSLSISATSDNPSLIPDPSVTYTSGNNSAALFYTPVAAQHGTATITVTVNDGGPGGTVTTQFLVTVVAVNHAPFSVELSNTDLAENQPVGTAVGTLSTLDPDSTDTFTYLLAAGAGDSNNASFQIVGDQLRTTSPLDFEAASVYSIRVRSTDQDGLSFEKVFTITVTDVNETPSIPSGQAFTVLTNADVGTVIGMVSASDPDKNAPNSSKHFNIIAGNMSGVFAIDVQSGQISVENAAVLKSLGGQVLTLQISETDGGTPPLSTVQSIFISVTHVDSPPVLATPGPAPIFNAQLKIPVQVVPNLSVTDPDGGATLASVQISVNPGSAKKNRDVINFSNLPALGTRVDSIDSGRLVITLTFKSGVTNVAVQNLLQSMTFLTKGSGLKIPIRNFQLQVIDKTGLRSNVVTQNIQVKRK